MSARRLLSAVIGPLLGGAFYLLLIDTVSSPELWAALGGLLLIVLTSEAARRQGLAGASVRVSWILRGWRAGASIPRHIAIVTWEALVQLVRPKAQRGSLRVVRFAYTGEEPGDIGRRALAEALGSLAPNSIVVGVDTDRGLLLVHQLRRSGSHRELDPLELG